MILENYKEKIEVVLSIDIGGTSYKGALVNKNGDIIYRARVKAAEYGSNKKFLYAVSNLILKLTKDLKRNNEKVIAMSFSVPGVIDSDNGIIKYSNNLNIEDVHFKEELNQAFKNIPVFMLNDANAATLGEATESWSITITTKTNKDVVEEEIDALLGESYPSMISSENILNRIRLYKSDRATITYELKNADDAQYVKIGQYSSGVYYVEVNDTTFPSVTTQITVVATVAYGTGENVVEETAEISFLCIDSVDNLTEFDSYYYAADGANVSFSGVVTYASYTKPMALVQGDGGAVYVYFKTSNVTEDEFKSLFVIGNKVSLKGTKDIFNGLNEFVVAKASDVKVEANAQTLPAYTDIRPADLRSR